MRLADHPMMAEALAVARSAGTRGEVPVGAVLVRNEAVVARAGNQVEATGDPTAHAEMLVLRAGTRILGRHLTDCDLFVTLEPCPMCAHAIALARIRRLYFGAPDPKGGGVEHGPRVFESTSVRNAPEVYGGIGERAASELLSDFFRALRT